MHRGGLWLFVALVATGCVNLGTPAEPTPADDGGFLVEPPTPSTPSPSPTPSVSPSPTPSPPPEPTPAPPEPPAPAEPANATNETQPPPAPTPTSPTVPWTEPASGGGSSPGAPVRLSLGGDALAEGPYVVAKISGDKKSFNVTLRAVSEATLRADDVVRVRNHEDHPYLIELSTAPLADARLVSARLLLGASSVDLLTGTPTLTMELPANSVARIGFEITVSGAPEEAIVSSQPVQLTVYDP